MPQEYFKRQPEIYADDTSDYDGRELETTVEVEGTHYEVVYNQYGNQFEVLSAKIYHQEYVGEPEFNIDEVYVVIEDILHDEFERNYDFGNE